MSRNSVITIVAGCDVMTFGTANRELCERLMMKVGQVKEYHKGDAVAFINGSTEFHHGVSDHYRKIVFMFTDFQRMHYSDSLNAMLSSADPRPMSEKYQEVEDNCDLSVSIHYQD